MTNDTHNLTPTERDARWELSGLTDPYPHLPAPGIAITPWTDDADLAEAVAGLSDVYPGADAAVLLGAAAGSPRAPAAGSASDAAAHTREVAGAMRDSSIGAELSEVKRSLEQIVVLWHKVFREKNGPRNRLRIMGIDENLCCSWRQRMQTNQRTEKKS
ncbi:hypothetical protein [Mycolicibacterium peregrinum]|uniref:hypothetical protein n=1 Tax=Mycolicibacterium peregrinum TaxID=43304 RepID=UPI000A8EBB1B|nr:hypothetical protein [Mycolicibacterium peregrinum]